MGITNTIPLDGGSNNSTIYIEGQESQGAIPPIRRYKSISPGYLRAMGSRPIAGRDLTWTETYHKAPVVLMSENMARELWRDPRAALGKRIRLTMDDDLAQVIGVVEDLRDDGVDQKAPAIAY